MFQAVDTKNPGAVQAEVQAVYADLFPAGEPDFVPGAFAWVADGFAGRHGDLQPIDARYHDFEHTLQGTLCLARLLHGRQRAGAEPVFSQRDFELTLLAILLHDIGYLKHRDDTEGTGAKYTRVHVARSAEFAGQWLAEKQCPPADIAAVQRKIRCTGVNVNLAAIPFSSLVERVGGFAVGTSDLLGQMAAPDYVDKLPVLYSEFEESGRYNGGSQSGVGVFASAEDLMRQTPRFWENYVRPKLERDFAGIYQFLNQPYPDGANYYLDRIGANIARLQRQMAAVAP